MAQPTLCTSPTGTLRHVLKPLLDLFFLHVLPPVGRSSVPWLQWLSLSASGSLSLPAQAVFLRICSSWVVWQAEQLCQAPDCTLHSPHFVPGKLCAGVIRAIVAQFWLFLQVKEACHFHLRESKKWFLLSSCCNSLLF